MSKKTLAQLLEEQRQVENQINRIRNEARFKLKIDGYPDLVLSLRKDGKINLDLITGNMVMGIPSTAMDLTSLQELHSKIGWLINKINQVGPVYNGPVYN